MEKENSLENKLSYHLLPTEERSYLIINCGILERWNTLKKKSPAVLPQYLYLCSQREIKEGEWMYIVEDTGKVYIEKCPVFLGIHYIKKERIEFTTDPKLIADGVSTIPEKCWFNTPTKGVLDSLNFLEFFVKCYNEQKKVEKKTWKYVEGVGRVYSIINNKEGVDAEKLVNKYTERILVDYPEKDKLHIDLMSFLNESNQALQSDAGGFSLEDVEWISNNQFTFNGKKWSSTKIHYMGTLYTTKELRDLIQSLTKEQPKEIGMWCELECSNLDVVSFGFAKSEYKIKLNKDGCPVIHFK